MKKVSLPDKCSSLWKNFKIQYKHEKLKENIDTDVCIVGAGLTGILTGYLLKKKGIDFVILDSDRIGNGASFHTTAKLTCQHGLIYNKIEKYMGFEAALKYYKANLNGFNLIKKIIEDKDIDCSFEKQDSFVYTNFDKYLKEIEKEIELYEKIGINGNITNSFFAGFQYKSSIVMYEQALFNPSEFINGIVKDFDVIYTDTTAVDIERNNSKQRVITKDGFFVESENVVIATHYPFLNARGLYFARIYPERGYLLAAKSDFVPDGMYINKGGPVRSIRNAEYKGNKIIIVAGETRKLFKQENENLRYKSLKKFAEENFNIKEIIYKWSNQDLTTIDEVPFVGRLTPHNENVYVATGFGNWGMTNSASAALIITDYITKNENENAEIFSPRRFNAKEVKTFIMESGGVIKKYAEGKLESSHINIEDLEKEEGGITLYNNKKSGVYRDSNNSYHIVELTCTHMTCSVKWNSAEKTWDCPCHGSRYSIYGEVLEGPAKKGLNYHKLNIKNS